MLSKVIPRCGNGIATDSLRREAQQILRRLEYLDGKELEVDGNAQHDGAVADLNGEIAVMREHSVQFSGENVFADFSIADGE